MSTRRRRNTSRTRRLGGNEAQQRQAAELSARFWHGGTGDSPAADQPQGVDHIAVTAAGSTAVPVLGSAGHTRRIRVTPDPTSTVRSLGKPPLNGREMVAEHYFEAVYQRAVAMAGALAAAGGLLGESDEATTTP